MDSDPKNSTAEAAAVWVEIERLKPWSDNPRDNDHAVEGVAESIRRFGFGAPILARKADGEIIAGHTRIKAAVKLGLDRVPVRYLDLDPVQAHLLALADNRLGEIADWSGELSEVLRGLEAEGADLDGLGWSSEELGELMARLDATEPSTGDDDAPEVDEDGEADSQRGMVYQLGPHRLVCGDSRDPAVWEALLAGGERLRMVWTDPPYGVAYVGGNHMLTPEERRAAGGQIVENDEQSPEELRAFLADALGLALAHCEPGAAWYVAAPPGPLHQVFGAVLLEFGVWRQTLVWIKDRFVLGRSDYHYRHEPIFYGWAPGAAHFFVDDRTLDSVLEVQRPTRSAEHPTMKPIDLVRRCIENSSKPGWIVGEPFGGSGTTLIASAAAGRVARVIEFAPRYCDVIRRRWTRWAKDHGLDPGPGALE